MKPSMTEYHKRQWRFIHRWKGMRANARILAATFVLCYVCAFTRLSSQRRELKSKQTHVTIEAGGVQIDPHGFLGILIESSFRPGLTASPSLYENLPVSNYRPLGQYVTAPTLASQPAVITVITGTFNPGHAILRTACFILQQSLQSFNWIVVNDHSDDPVSLLRLHALHKVAQTDWRVRVLDNPGVRGPDAAKNFGLRSVKTQYVAFLDDDDLWEMTTLEKAVLAMSWVPAAYAVGFDVVNHGAKEFVWSSGFHNGDENFHTENFIAQGSPMRTVVFEACQFSHDFSRGAEDWDMWMCMASHGMWGLHISERGTWYQNNPSLIRKKRWANLASATGLAETHARIRERYSNTLDQDDFWPQVLPPPFNSSNVAWGPLPFKNAVAPSRDKRLLIIIKQLNFTAPTVEVLRYVKSLAESGWRITILETHHSPVASGINDAFKQYTHDIFASPLIAPTSDLLRLVNYLISSRRVTVVMVVNTSLGYAMLPILATNAPGVQLIDYVHSTDEPISIQSVQMDTFLDRTLVPTSSVYTHLIGRGKPFAKMVVSRGVDVDLCKCGSRAHRALVRKRLGIESGQVLIAVAETSGDASEMLIKDAIVNVVSLSQRNHIRVFWPSPRIHALLGDISVDVSGAFVISSGRVLEKHVRTAADVVIVGNANVHTVAASFGCQGATVLMDRSVQLPGEVSWEWGHGAIIDTPAPRNARDVERYARDIMAAMNKMLTDAVVAFEPLQDGAKAAMDKGRVTCVFHRDFLMSVNAVHIPPPRTEDSMLNLTSAIIAEALKIPETFDMRAIQIKLQYRKVRTGFGREVQRKCPERVYKNMQWIDSLEADAFCPGQSIDAHLLRMNVLSQCGAWCVANVAHSTAPYGWSFNGACWSAVEHSTDPCMPHIYQRH